MENITVNQYSCYKSANDNTIYVCLDDDIEIWKLSIDLLKKSMVAPIFLDYYYQVNSPLNELGYILVWFEDGCYENKAILYEALKFYKIDFEFDKSTLQEIFDSLDEDKQENVTYFENVNFNDLGFSTDCDYPDDLVNHFKNIFAYREWGVYPSKYIEREEDVDMDLHLFDFAATLKENEIKQKKIEEKYKIREKEYKKLGCKILSGKNALKAIHESFEYSMFAINTDEYYSVEFSGWYRFCSDLEDAPHYTVRKKIKGRIQEEDYWEVILPEDIFKYKWAIKKYHSEFSYLQ